MRAHELVLMITEALDTQTVEAFGVQGRGRSWQRLTVDVVDEGNALESSAVLAVRVAFRGPRGTYNRNDFEEWTLTLERTRERPS